MFALSFFGQMKTLKFVPVFDSFSQGEQEASEFDSWTFIEFACSPCACLGAPAAKRFPLGLDCHLYINFTQILI